MSTFLVSLWLSVWCATVLLSQSSASTPPVSVSWTTLSANGYPAHTTPGCFYNTSALSSSSMGVIGSIGGGSALMDVWWSNLSATAVSAANIPSWSTASLVGVTKQNFPASVMQPNGVIAAIGGQLSGISSAIVSTVLWSTTSFQTWQTYAAPFCPRTTMAYTAAPSLSLVLIAGGSNDQSNNCSTNDVWIGQSIENGVSAWSQQSQNVLPANWYAGGAAMIGNNVVLTGGLITSPTITYYNTVWVSSNLGVSWNSNQAPFAPRAYPQMVSDSSSIIYVYGGLNTQTTVNNDLWYTADLASSWQTVAAAQGSSGLAPALAASCIALLKVAAGSNQQLILYGGEFATSSAGVTNVYVGQLSFSSSSAANTHSLQPINKVVNIVLLAATLFVIPFYQQ